MDFGNPWFKFPKRIWGARSNYELEMMKRMDMTDIVDMMNRIDIMIWTLSKHITVLVHLA